MHRQIQKDAYASLQRCCQNVIWRWDLRNKAFVPKETMSAHLNELLMSAVQLSNYSRFPYVGSTPISFFGNLAIDFPEI